ncbi:MAG: anthranilate phosphoribosyltransferase [Opitutales bacterium]|nr:anthranilate phosphoribosyltransferase [Opitutales bacterium]
MALSRLVKKLKAGGDLTAAEAEGAARTLASAEAPPADKKAFLVALSEKGETVEEVAAFAKTFRALARDPRLDAWQERAIDMVGTGGSGFGGFNVTSVASLIVAAHGVPVLKHGNRAITSKSGSADFFGALGIPMLTDPAELRRSVESLGFCFFFAPGFHPAFKEIMPVRKELAGEGRRTVFNILGPLINPAQPARQLLGVFHPRWVQPLADVLEAVGVKTGMAVCSELPGGQCIDELTTAGENHIAGFGTLRGMKHDWSFSALGLEPCTPEELHGGDAEANVARLRELITGKAPRGLEDTVCLNAAAGLLISGAVNNPKAGLKRAREILRSGELASWLARARGFFAEPGS